MKANRINRLARLTGITIALALFAGVAGTAYAQNGAKGGATKLLELNGTLVTPKSGPSDYKPMSCGKCKDEFVKRVDWSARGANKPTITVAKHLCDGCGTEWNVVGHGKAKANVATHKCTSCGEASLACCNTKKSANVATKGMEKKFEAAPLK
jgi:hypothetical protein